MNECTTKQCHFVEGANGAMALGVPGIFVVRRRLSRNEGLQQRLPPSDKEFFVFLSFVVGSPERFAEMVLYFVGMVFHFGAMAVYFVERVI